MNNRAFTLIELIVVMMLVSALLLIALPSLKDTISAYPIRVEVRKLVDRIEETRSRANREQVDHMLHVDIDNGRFWTCRRLDPVELQQRSGNNVWTLPNGIRVDGIVNGSGKVQKSGEAQILFSGQNYAQPTVIHLVRDKFSISLTINPLMNTVEIHNQPMEDSE